MRGYSNWQWHLGEIFVKFFGETSYLRRAVDHEGEVLECYVTKRRDRKTALKFLRKLMKRYGKPEVIVTDKLRSYGAAMKVIGNAPKQETGRWLNKRAENSHLPFRRRERAMLRFDRCDVCRDSPTSTLLSTTISIRNALFTAEAISNSPDAPLFLSGVSSVPHKFTSPAVN